MLVSGIGAPALGPGVLRNLRESRRLTIRIVGVDASPSAVGRHLVDEFQVVPHGDDPSYRFQVERLVRESSVDVIVPLTDSELPSLLEVGESAGIPVVAPPLDASLAALDKGVLLEMLGRLSPSSFPSRVARTREQVMGAAHALGYPERDVVVKPCRGTGARGVWVLSAAADGMSVLFERRALPIATLDLYVAALPDVFPPVVVSHRVEGPEYTVACMDDGDVRVTIPIRRDGFRPGVTTAGTFERHVEVIEECERLVEALGMRPYCNVQLIHDGERPRVIEVNPRLSTTAVTCARAGLNLPEALVASAVGLEPEYGQIDWGLRFERFDAEFYSRAPSHG